MRRPYAYLSSSRANGPVASWYWRVLAFVCSWSLLCGYLILPSLYDKDPQLRIPGIVLTIIAVALLTVGISVSALLFFACTDYAFRRDQLFIPCFSASFLGLLTLLFHFVVSTRYQWTAAAIAGTAVSCITSVGYGLLALWVNSEYATLRHQRSNSTSHVPLRADDTSYYSTDTFPAPLNAQAVDSEPGIYVYPSGQAVQAMPMRPVFDDTDEERTRQQMLSLLLRANPEAAQGRERSPSNSSTYHIDLPQRQMTSDQVEELKSRIPAGMPKRVWVENPVARSEVLAPSSHRRSHSHTHEWEPEELSVPARPRSSDKHVRTSSAPREPPSVLISSPHTTSRGASPPQPALQPQQQHYHHQQQQQQQQHHSPTQQPQPPPSPQQPEDNDEEEEEEQAEGSSSDPAQLLVLPAARYVPKTTPAKREKRRLEIEGGNR